MSNKTLKDLITAAVLVLEKDIRDDVLKKSLTLKSVNQELRLGIPTIEAVLLSILMSMQSDKHFTLANFEMQLNTPYGTVYIDHEPNLEKRTFHVIN